LALEELGHTLDALAATGGAVAVSARVGPGQWSGWPTRLVNRLVGGLSVRVDRPGPASRRRYLLDHGRGLRLSAEAVDALAEAADGYRTLDGWLARIALAGRVNPGPLGVAEIEAILAEDGATPSLSVEQIVKDVAAKFGIRPSAIRSSARHASLVGPRHLAMHLARELTPLSFAAIGAYFGGRDAATVRHACRAATARIDADPALAAAVSALRQRWRQGSEDGET
jgi:chromosomal replication initiator protein